MTIGTDLDQAFYNLGQRLTRLEKKEVAYPIENEVADKETVLGIEATLTSQIERLEERIDECENDMNFDPDDLRCDFETQIEEVRDSVMHQDDRLDEVEAYKLAEDEVEYIVDRKLDDRFSEALTDAVCEEINSRAVSWTEHRKLEERVLELEARLNKPSLTARIVRWLREGPSIKETATGWYAGIRRGR